MQTDQPLHDIDDSAFSPATSPPDPEPTPARPVQATSSYNSMPSSQPGTPAPSPVQQAAPAPTPVVPVTSVPPAAPVSASLPAAPAPPPAPSRPQMADVVAPATAINPPPRPRSASATSFSPPSQTALQHVPDEVIKKISEAPERTAREIESDLHHHPHNWHPRRILSVVSFGVLILGVAWLINLFVFQSYFVDGTSMTPTLQNSDRLIISKVEKSIATAQGKPYIPNRGQIVVLDSSIVGSNGQEEQLIKRVIGLPGDTIHIQDGKVLIKNGEFPDGFDANVTLGLKLEPTYTDGPLDFTVGDHQVFVMGDNRVQNGSYDSRAFGPVDVKNLEGRLWARILPIDQAKVFSMLQSWTW